MRPLLFAGLALIALSSHDMYLKLDGYFLKPESVATIQLFNGTFARSDNTIDRNRMLDVSLVGGGSRMQVDTNQWTEIGETTVLNLMTGAPGTYVAGVSTRARNIAMDADAFNNYLEHDGVVDMLAERRSTGKDKDDAVEKYAKHVKTIFQVGSEKTDDWKTVLGYPIEFVPLSNPYALHRGDEFSVRLLLNGEPLAGQLVLIDSEGGDHGHSHSHDGETDHDHGEGAEDHTHTDGTEARTDEDGVLTFEITNDGDWFLRTIYMTETEEEGLTHESNWTTLTFGVDHEQEHSHDHEEAHAEGHDHEHAGGIPGYAYWIGSLLLVGALFMYFSRKG
jgi:hypothetical protein